MTGQTIGQYEVLEKLGEGGMGVVYRAHDTKLDRDVALKFLPSHLAASESDRTRFIQEARAASALTHPNICTIHDVMEHEVEGSSGRQLYIVMELVEGKNLRDLIGGLSQKQAIDIAVQVADGLAAAHEKGIVHRDIKPENIIVRKDGRAQIMDFGLAKFRGVVSRLTREGSTVGTAGYMSPEQVQGLDTDHRSDIFSFGVVLYEMLAGRPPFSGVHETAMIYEIVNTDPPPVATIKPDIDPGCDAVILECMAKDPSERYQSIAEAGKDLRRVRRESTRQHATRRMTIQQPVAAPAVTTPAVPPHRRLWTLVVPGLLAVALAVSLWFNLRSSPDFRESIRFTVPMSQGQKLNTSTHRVVAISPDGMSIVYLASGKLFLRRMNSLTASEIQGTDDAVSPFFSPDGRWIAFFANGKLKKILLEGGSPIELADSKDSRGGCWGADGRIVFTPDAVGGIVSVSDAGGPVTIHTIPDTTAGERTHRWPCLLPDGKTVLFTLGFNDSPDYYEDATIGAVDLSTGKRSVVMKGGSSAGYIPGYLLYTHAGVLLAAPFDPKRLALTGPAFTVQENISGEATTAAMNFAVSPTGNLAYIPGRVGVGVRRLVLTDTSGHVTTLPAPDKNYIEPKAGPDGNRIAVTIQDGKEYDIWIYDLTRNTLSRFTFEGVNRSAAWSPDGKQIAWWYNNDGKPQLKVKASDGTGQATVLNSTVGRAYVDQWSRDGKSLVLDHIHSGTESDIELLPASGGSAIQPLIGTQFDEWLANISPDGRWIAYTSNESGKYQVYLQSYPSLNGKWQVSADEGYQPKWSPDGKSIYYYSSGDMYVVPVSLSGSPSIGRARKIIPNFPSILNDSGMNYDLMPDGRKFVMAIAPGDNVSYQEVNVVINWADEIKRRLESKQ